MIPAIAIGSFGAGFGVAVLLLFKLGRRSYVIWLCLLAIAFGLCAFFAGNIGVAVAGYLGFLPACGGTLAAGVLGILLRHKVPAR